MNQSLTIKNLCPGLMERGKIKIGIKGKMTTSRSGKKFQLPQKLDYFRVTTTQRDDSGNFALDSSVHEMIGDKPTRIPILLMYNDVSMNFQSRYVCFKGKRRWCSGDGESAMRLSNEGSGYVGTACPCERNEPEYEGQEVCKTSGTLSCMIAGIEQVGGCWKFRTTGYNSTISILSSLSLISSMTGGRLAGIPLDLVVGPKTGINPHTGDAVTIYVVWVEYAGTMEALREAGYQRALDEAKYNINMDQIEDRARKLISVDAQVISDDPDAHAEEFYPDEADPPQELQEPEEGQDPEEAESSQQTNSHRGTAAGSKKLDQPAPQTFGAVDGAPRDSESTEEKPKRGRGRPRKKIPVEEQLSDEPRQQERQADEEPQSLQVPEDVEQVPLW